MKKGLKFLMTLYASFVFIFWIFVAYCVFLILVLFYGTKKDRTFLIFFYRVIGKLVSSCMFLTVKKEIHYAFDENESYVVVSNHVGMIDIPANVSGSPKEILFKFLGKKEANKIPFFGFIINRVCILVDRKDDASRKNSYLKMQEEMDKGFSIFIYPEGTRNRTDKPIAKFYDGAFKLAIEMQKPIVVNTLVGIKELNPPTSYFTYLPGKVVSHWDKPIPTKGMTLEDMEDLKQKVKAIMISRLN